MKDITTLNEIYKLEIKPYNILIKFLIITTLLIISLNKIKYNKYYFNSSNVISKNKIEMYVNKNDLDKVYNNKKIIIKEREFAYTIEKISEPIFNIDYYYRVILNIKLDDNINKKNNLVNIKILLDRKTILKYIIQKIGG